jgi:1-acyl-sn-glycerol-3-phosphate acyltransferase
MILVSRRWTNDARLIERAFARVKRNAHGVWIVLYPEGTRKTSNKLLKAIPPSDRGMQSQAFARRTGKHELEHLLQPRTKGFVATIRGQFGLKVALSPDLQLTQI